MRRLLTMHQYYLAHQPELHNLQTHVAELHTPWEGDNFYCGGPPMALNEFWRFATTFDIHEAASLWCELEPHRSDGNWQSQRKYRAIFKQLHDAHDTGKLHADTTALRHPDAHPIVFRRTELMEYAKSIGTFPRFLFDTLVPSPPSHQLQNRPTPNAHGGGPKPTIDWNALVIELIRIADTDGLPSKRTEAVERLQSWHSDRYGREPSRSEVFNRVSLIYDSLEAQRWTPRNGLEKKSASTSNRPDLAAQILTVPKRRRR